MSPARSVATVAALALAVGGLSLLPGAAPQAQADVLVPYTGCDELLEHYRSELVRAASPYGNGFQTFGLTDDRSSAAGTVTAESLAAVAAPAPAAVAADAVGAGSTGTNLQERGVDEPDLAKAVDGLLYVLSQGGLQILRAGAEPELLSSFGLGRYESYGAELLVQGDSVLVLMSGGSYADGHAAIGVARDSSTDSYPVGDFSKARLILIDAADPTAPRLVETLELDGRYLSARLSGGAVRLVTASNPSLESTSPAEPYGPAQERSALETNREIAASATVDQVLPRAVRTGPDGTQLAAGPAVECDQVRHTSEPQGTSTLLVTTLDLTKGLAAQDSTAVTTDGELVYASTDRLYVATSRWGTSPSVSGSNSESMTIVPARGDDVTTELHAFDTTSPTSTRYAGSGSVDGYVYGRWALSSHEGHLRVATTTSPPWGGSDAVSSSIVTVLEENADGLVETGRIEGLGLTEQIYAVRYFGDVATVVTFRQTDPLYVLDLGDPSAPKLLGELKVPGFSTYLHPVGGDRLLGVGQDATDEGQVTGMQISLFDLSDLSTPTQLDRLPLGQASSPALGESRAFGYDAVRGMAVFPMTTYDSRLSSTAAVGVRVTANGTLEEIGRLDGGTMRTVMPEDYYPAEVERVLQDGEHVYAITRTGIVAGDADDLRRTGSVDFPIP